MAARLHICPLGTLELEGVGTAARADLDKHLLGHLVDIARHTILVLHVMLRRDHGRRRERGGYTSSGRGANVTPPRSGGLTV